MGPKDTNRHHDWQDLMREGIKLRETGDREDLNKSVEILIKSANIAEAESGKADIMTVLNQLGLTYFHIGDYTTAVDIWNMVYNVSKVQTPQLLRQMAESLRHRSRKELCNDEKSFESAANNASSALSMVIDLGSSDIVWFRHGVFSADLAYMKSRKYIVKDYLKELVDSEREDLMKVWKTAPKLERNVWLGGLLMDYAVVYNKVSKPLLKIARLLFKILNLRRREEQITKLINEIG